MIVEFSFDVVQAASGAYVSDAFRSFIGFRVASGLLQRGFLETYGLTMQELFADHDRAIASYRYAISQIIPVLTEAAWRDNRGDAKLNRGHRRGSCAVDAARRERRVRVITKPALRQVHRLLYRFVPKIGPLKALESGATP